MSVNFTLPGMRRDSKPTIFAASFMYLIAMMGLWFAPYAAYPLNYLLSNMVPGFNTEIETCVVQTVFYGLFILLPVIVYAKRYPSCAESMRINPISGKAAALCVLASVVGVLFINYVTSVWMILIEALGGTPTDSGISIPDTSGGLAGMILFIAVMPGICEEILFRGVMLGAWEEKGSLQAMVIVSIWFTMLHSSIEGVPSEFITGLILAFVVISTGSIFSGMIYHTVHNAMCLIIAYAASGVDVPVEAEAGAKLIDSMGGAFGVIMLFVYILFSGAALLFILKKIDSIRLREERFEFGLPALPKREFSFPEFFVMASAVIASVMMYLVNLLEIVGIL